MRTTFLSTILSSAFSGSARWSLALLALLGLLGSRSAQASETSSWQFDPTESALELRLEPGVAPRYFLLPNPLRLVVDLPGTPLGQDPVDEQMSGDINRIRVSEFQPGMTRVVLELAPNSVLQDEQVALSDLGDGQWQIRPLLENPPLAENRLLLNTPEADAREAIELPVLTSDRPDGAFNSALADSSDDFPEDSQGSLEELPNDSLGDSWIAQPPLSTTAIHSFEPLPLQYSQGLPTVPPGEAAELNATGVVDEPVDEPRVPFMVEFGEPLPGISADFPAAYMRSDSGQ